MVDAPPGTPDEVNTRIEALERQLAEARADVEFFKGQFNDQVESREHLQAERDHLAADNARLREALERLLNPAPGVKKLPPWVFGIAKPALAGKE